MGRTSLSWKRTAWPSWVAMRISWSPSVSFTLMSWSPSSNVRARMPLWRMFFSWSTGRRFTVPSLVVMNRYRGSSSVSRKWSMAWTFSPVSTWMTLTMLMPLAVLPLSGI